ncbi:hypothetical protein [Cytobacillus gottheilii]|uniref:hypothetical protein n=1 Tax=Cytobacillus gottheilii TaxID=859144 RepID=UPI0009BBD432|nr:hypothetical protein [Cytobacillus gottheilii]
MFFGSATGLKLIIDNETSKTLSNLTFYVNGKSAPRSASIKRIKPADRKIIAIIPQGFNLLEDHYALSMSMNEWQETLEIQQEVGKDYYGSYLIEIREDDNDNLYVECRIVDF